MKGLEALNKLVNRIETDMNSDDYYECKNAKEIIEKELKALEIIRNHSDWSILEINQKFFPKEYLLVVGDIGKKVITKEEYDLLKETLITVL